MNYIVNQQNIQKYAERLTNDLCRQFFINKAFISGPEILQFNSENQLNLLIVKNIFLNWQKESLKLKNPFFDYENEEVKQALKNFMNILSRHIKVYRYDFEPIVKKSVAEMIMLAAAPQDFFTREIEGLASPKVQLSLLKDFCKYIKINKFVVEQVISEIETAGYSEYFGGETIRHMLKAINENPDKMAVPEMALNGLLEQLQGEITDFVSVPKPMVTRPAFIDEKPESNMLKSNTVWDAPAQAETKAEENEPENKHDAAPPFESPFEGTGQSGPGNPIFMDDELEEPEAEADPEFEAEEISSEIADDYTPAAEAEENETIARKRLFTPDEDIDSPVADIEISGAAAVSLDPVNLNDALKMSEERPTLAQTLQARSVAAPFKTLVPMHYRFTFINALFAGNQQAWAEAVEKIDQTESPEEAIAILKSEYGEKYNWDKEEDNLAILYSYIERKF